MSDFPPGTSKWNIESVVALIGNTRTKEGLRAKANYRTGVKITKAEMRRLDIRPRSFRGEWNYDQAP